jgi:hypothetical protein
LILLVSMWLNWVGLGSGDAEPISAPGYEVDSLIPFMGLLGLGFALALLYATKRADRGQHRGLSLASMAVGLASLIWIIFFLRDPIETVKYAGYTGEDSPNVTTEYGLWIGLLGALLWTLGSLILAKEPEGDIEHDTHRTVETQTRPAQTTRHAEVTETRPANVTDREVVDRHRTDTQPVAHAEHRNVTTRPGSTDDLSTVTRRDGKPDNR